MARTWAICKVAFTLAVGVPLLGVAIASNSPATAAPAAVQVSPRVAATGTNVHVSGGGCATDVRITVTGFLFPNPPAVLVDATVTPGAGGEWFYDFPMPAVPAYVVAGCDGGDASPVVVAPNDVDVGSMAPAAVTPTTVEVATSPLVEGSDLTAFMLDGSVLAGATAVGGTASLSLARSIGPVTVLVLGLRAPDPTIPLPYLPIARRLQMPLSAPPTLTASPRVTATGGVVTLAGTCAGTPHVVVRGRPAGWYDAPPVYADVTDLPADGPFELQIAMPPLPSVVQLTCSSGAVFATAQLAVAPADGDLVTVVPTAEGDAFVASLPRAIASAGLEAFTTTGEPVALEIVDSSDPTVVRVLPPIGAVGVVILGVETLGENANALQNSRVQAWTFAVPGSVVPTTSSTSTVPATTPDSTPATTTPVLPTPPEPAAPTPPASLPTLPATGRRSTSTFEIGVLLVAAGALLVALSRRRLVRR